MMMEKLKVSFAAMAVVLGLGSALASTSAPKAFANKTWGHRADGTYIDVTNAPGTYSCASSANVCTAVYPATQNPNSNPANPISTTLGDFSN